MIEEKKFTHKSFKEGIENGTIGFQIIDLERFSKLVHKSNINAIKNLISILGFLLYITIPIVAFMLGKWVLLLGFFGCFLGIFLQKFCIAPKQQSARYKRSISATFFLGFLIIFMIYKFGIFNPQSFILFCTFYELVGSILISYLWIETGITALVNNKANYNYAIDNYLIEVFEH